MLKVEFMQILGVFLFLSSQTWTCFFLMNSHYPRDLYSTQTKQDKPKISGKCLKKHPPYDKVKVLESMLRDGWDGNGGKERYGEMREGG